MIKNNLCTQSIVKINFFQKIIKIKSLKKIEKFKVQLKLKFCLKV